MDQSLGIYAGVGLDSDTPYQCLGRGDDHTGNPLDKQNDILFFHPFTGLRNKALPSQPNYIHEVYIAGADSTVDMDDQLSTNTTPQLRRIDGSAFTYVEGHVNRVNISSAGFPVDLEADQSVAGFITKIITALDEIATRVYRNYVWNICTYRSDVFNPFTSQELVHTGYVHTDLVTLDSGDIFGGDTYINF